ncbi:hypothetical protein [Verrucomicrobium spinosum]|uniref:hypothetical protein n=1 Tax=Verrucomicrobium spinosum TaxID=2736 RepID=UPI000AB576EF|nr:hypothetical protein [Verrucomicrobium spinosum]
MCPGVQHHPARWFHRSGRLAGHRLLHAPERRDFVTFPDFDFNQLGKYLERGLWPMLTTAAVGIGVGLVLWLVFFIPIMILTALLSDSNGVVGGFFA